MAIMYTAAAIGIQAMLYGDPAMTGGKSADGSHDITIHYPRFSLDYFEARRLEDELQCFMGIDAEVILSAVRHDFGIDVHTYLSLTEIARVHCIIHYNDPPPCLPNQCLALEAERSPGCFQFKSEPETFTPFVRPTKNE